MLLDDDLRIEDSKLNSCFVAKDECYPELQLVILDFADISIDFYQ